MHGLLANLFERRATRRLRPIENEELVWSPVRPPLAGGAVGAMFAFFLVCAEPALAQPDQRLEIFAGYAYSTEPPGPSIGTELPTKHLHGWRAAATGYITSRLGMEFEFTSLSGVYAAIDSRVLFSPRRNPPIRQLTFVAGPRFKVLRTRHATTTIHALVGTARTRRADPHGLSLPSRGTLAFGVSLGGSFDLNVGPRVAIRLLEPSLFLCTGRRECREKSLRIASGLIIKF